MAEDLASARPGRSKRPPPSEESEELIDYCARPKCRNEFRRQGGPGRRRAYCCELCRRTAERELRQAQSRLAHFEGLVRQMRADVEAFGRTAEAEEGSADSTEARRKAEMAVARVAGILDFIASSDEPLARELKELFEAVAPVVRASG